MTQLQATGSRSAYGPFMSSLESWTPGITPAVLRFGEEVVARGFTVVMPSLFGRAGSESTVLESVRSIAGVCVSREFTMFALGRTTPVATWLQALARELHRELAGPGVGAVGMCLTGGYALAMLADAPVAAPVLAQPASPAPVGKAGVDRVLAFFEEKLKTPTEPGP